MNLFKKAFLFIVVLLVTVFTTIFHRSDKALDIIIDTSDWVYYDTEDFYGIGNQKIHTIRGRIKGDPGHMKSFTYEIIDEVGSILKRGNIPIEKKWEISEFCLCLGMNTITVEGRDIHGNSIRKQIKISCGSWDYAKTLNLDRKDNDRDGLSNYIETYYKTNKYQADSDKDGVSDSVELQIIGTNPFWKDTNQNGILDGKEDRDEDGLTNQKEIKLGLDPGNRDSDFDRLNDYEEVEQYKTNPLEEDSDGDGAKDKWEVENGFNPIKKEKEFSFVVTAENHSKAVTPSIIVDNVTGEKVNHMSMEEVKDNPLINEEIIGYIGPAFDFNLTDSLNSLQISFRLDKGVLSKKGMVPAIYYYNDQKQIFQRLENQERQGNVISGNPTNFSTYIVLNQKEYEEALQDNNTLTSGTGIPLFDKIEDDKVKWNKDLDGDGEKNKSEVVVQKNIEGDEYLEMRSSPFLADSDFDGLLDGDDQRPLDWDVCHRDLAIFAALAYEDGSHYINKMYKASDIKGIREEPGESYYFLQGASLASIDIGISTQWEIVDYVNEWVSIDSYFSATTFKNGDNLVVAYRGTNEPLGEWISNIIGVGLLNYHWEEGNAKAYINRIADQYPSCHIYITGHSLGGYLAQIAAAELLAKGATNLEQVVYFNGSGLQFNKLSFGTKETEIRYLKDYQKSGVLVSYYLEGDVVSSLGTHVGEKIGFLVTKESRKFHGGKYGSGELIDFLSKLALGGLTILTGVNVEEYYQYYKVKSVMEYFWITHETDSFYYYLKQGTRAP